jgi:hypothetical protein
MNQMSLIVLDSAEIAQVVFTVATPKAVCSILRTHSHVEAARRHLFENADEARRDIEEFVRERLVDLKPKTYFPHEPAFCALAVALETLPMPAAEDFLSELAALRIAEMPLSSRVATLCLKRRWDLVTANTSAVFKVAPLPQPNAPSQPTCLWISAEISYAPQILKDAA